MTLHRFFLVTHRWIGLVATVFLVILSVTGAILVYQPELERLVYRRLNHVVPSGSALPLDSILAIGQRARPALRPTAIAVPPNPETAYRVRFQNNTEAYVDPYRGVVLGVRGIGNSVVHKMRPLHRTLMLGRVGATITVVSSVASVLLTVGGLVLWWRRKIWRVKRTRSWRGVNFDLHNAIGLVSSLGIVVFSATAVFMDLGGQLDPVYRRMFGDAPNPRLAPPSPPRATRLSLDSLVRVGLPVVPGPLREIRLPNGALSPLVLAKKTPGENGFRARNLVWLDPHDGRVRGSVDQALRPMGTRIAMRMEDWHIGGYPGGWSRVYALLSCLLLAFQTVSGTLIWWKPRRRARRAIYERREVVPEVVSSVR